MWKNIFDLLSLTFTYAEKYHQQAKQCEVLESRVNDLTKQMAQMAVELARLAEREKLNAQLLNQALEIERLKLENEKLKSRFALPPVTEQEDQS